MAAKKKPVNKVISLDKWFIRLRKVACSDDVQEILVRHLYRNDYLFEFGSDYVQKKEVEREIRELKEVIKALETFKNYCPARKEDF